MHDECRLEDRWQIGLPPVFQKINRWLYEAAFNVAILKKSAREDANSKNSFNQTES
jgi:hypothetical protein